MSFLFIFFDAAWIRFLTLPLASQELDRLTAQLSGMSAAAVAAGLTQIGHVDAPVYEVGSDEDDDEDDDDEEDEDSSSDHDDGHERQRSRRAEPEDTGTLSTHHPPKWVRAFAWFEKELKNLLEMYFLWNHEFYLSNFFPRASEWPGCRTYSAESKTTSSAIKAS